VEVMVNKDKSKSNPNSTTTRSRGRIEQIEEKSNKGEEHSNGVCECVEISERRNNVIIFGCCV
jgi:hypothetical protein